jgi:tetratricopeptide (TPR) repeat protein
VLAAEDVEQLLLDKASYWRLKDRPDLAMDALNQLLSIDPNQVEGIYQLGMLDVQQSKLPDARIALARLQKVAPTSPHVADLENAIRAGRVGPNELNEARRLAQSGQLAEAVQKYQESFRGPPPAAFGVEYYLTLAGTPGGWEQAMQGLQQLSAASPNDKSIKLALAQVMINRETTRPDGIAALIALSKDPVVGQDAVKLWRQALIWGAPAPAYAQYLAQFPQDQEVRQRANDLATQRAGGGTGATQAQSQGYVDIRRGNLAAAQRQFEADLHQNPQDAQALAGLGLVRLRQERFAEARDLLGRAMRIAPDQRTQWAGAYESAAFWASVQRAKALQAQGKLQEAKALLSGLLARAHGDGAGAEMVLANIDQKLGDNAGAEQAFRRVLRAQPRNGDALIGLAGALAAEGKTAEAKAITDRLTPEQRARMAGGGGGPGEALRKEAKAAEAAGHYDIADQKFKAAISASPMDPWIRLDYARFLAGQGHIDQGFAVVDPKATGNTQTSVMVAAMYDVQQDRWAEALDLVDTVPAGQRSKDLTNFRDRILSRATEDQAKRQIAAGNRAAARDMLVALYNNPDVRPDERRVAAYDLWTLGFHDAALQVTRDAMNRGGPAGIKAGIDYAKLLVSAGRYDDATAVVNRLEAGGQLAADDRDNLLSVKALLVSRQVDKLLAKHRVADAYDLISPIFVERPNDPVVLVTVGRIYAVGGRNREALGYFDKAFQQDPGDINIIRGVVMGAIEANDLSEAQNYLDKGEQANPKNPWIFFLKGQLAHARGENGLAMSDLRTAQAMAREQGLTTPSESEPAVPQPKLPPNPFRSSQNFVPPGFWLGGAWQGSANARRFG